MREEEAIWISHLTRQSFINSLWAMIVPDWANGIICIVFQVNSFDVFLFVLNYSFSSSSSALRSIIRRLLNCRNDPPMIPLFLSSYSVFRKLEERAKNAAKMPHPKLPPWKMKKNHTTKRTTTALFFRYFSHLWKSWSHYFLNYSILMNTPISG